MSSVKAKPSKRRAAAEASSRAPSTAAKKPRKPKGMVELPEGTVLIDLTKKKWRLGKLIGWGGFGALYLASPDDGSAVKDNAAFVVKMEPHTNGPLFTELAFYQRVAKPELIASWCKSHRLKHLGVPVFWGCGSIDHGSTKLRFLVMDRFGKDVDELFVSNGRRFDITTVLMLGLRILDILEYIHSHEYAHADIKGSNLMMGFSKSSADQLYLLDYGLVYRFNPEGNHKKYKEDPKRKHDGTIEFTSRDAHNGVVPARRCDLEILGYVMLQWLCDRLPWEKNLSNKEYVQNEKIRYMRDIPQLMQDCFNGDHPVEIQKYLQYIDTLEYEQEPDYERLRKLFKDGLKRRGCTDDGRSVKFKSGQASTMSSSDADTLGSNHGAETRNSLARPKPVVKKSKKRQSEEDCNDSSPPKKLRSGPRKQKAKEMEKVTQSDTSKKPRTAGRRRKPVMVDTATSP